MTTRQASKVISSALTAASAPQTKAQPICIRDWAAWLRIQTFDDPELDAIVENVAQFCLSFKRGDLPAWLSILGPSGVGKTHCATRVWTWMRNRSEWGMCVYLPEPIYWPTFVDELRSGLAYEKLAELADWPVLFLDDIGAERDATGFAAEKLNALLGRRVGKWTILTSNLLLNQLAKIDPRISDRIIREPGNLFVEVETTSYGLRQRAMARTPYTE